MEYDIIYSSEYIQITKSIDGFYIESFKKGMSIEQFNKLMGQHPEMKIISFMAIKNALLFAPRSIEKFGEVKNRVTVEVSSDELRAYITLCVTDAEFLGETKITLVKEIIQKLNAKGIVFGVKHNALSSDLINDKQILIAEGVAPINGEDSVIKMYELKEAKPEVKEDGNVDHYELNLINKVQVGDWLGEKTDPTAGIPGKSILGNTILPMPGKNYPLFYDRNSVKEVYQNGITTLHSMRTGAVHFEGDKICVSNHLEITSNVDFKTGNIDFDGFLTVKGSIDDSFSILANRDIEILGDYGVGSVKEIMSREGSVYIKGGIAGKNRAIVKSKKDIYTKFVSDATIICEGSVHIGFYCLNSTITAKEVILDSPKGQIIGGNIQAEIKVISSIIGSPSEKRTVISVKGFDRRTLRNKLEKVVTDIEGTKNSLTRCKQELSIYTSTNSLTKEQRAEYERVSDRFFGLRDALKQMEDERKALVSYLRTHGEGEICILKKAFPNTMLELKGIPKELDKAILGTTFYYQDDEIREL